MIRIIVICWAMVNAGTPGNETRGSPEKPDYLIKENLFLDEKNSNTLGNRNTDYQCQYSVENEPRISSGDQFFPSTLRANFLDTHKTEVNQ